MDEQRRKYFNIANNVRLEVSVSPYSYTMALQDINFDREKKRESYAVENNGPATRDESSCFFLKLSERLRELRIKQEELAQMQKQLQAEYTELMDKCLDSIEYIA